MQPIIRRIPMARDRENWPKKKRRSVSARASALATAITSRHGGAPSSVARLERVGCPSLDQKASKPMNNGERNRVPRRKTLQIQNFLGPRCPTAALDLLGKRARQNRSSERQHGRADAWIGKKMLHDISDRAACAREDTGTPV